MSICWITIYVNNMAESVKFYTEIMGLTISHRFSPQPGMEITFLNAGSIQLELIYDPNNPDISIGKDISIGFQVPSLDAKTEELKGMGIGSIIGPISPTPHISFIYITDPNGLKLQIVEQKV